MTTLFDALGSRLATTLWLVTAGLRRPALVPVRVPVPVPVPVPTRRMTVTLGR